MPIRKMARGGGSSSRVHVHSIVTVVPSRPVGSGKLHPLSALDHAMGRHSSHLVFYFQENPIKVLDFLHPVIVSLSEFLSLYPLLSGRLIRDDETGNWMVKCNDAGVRVLMAKVRVGLDEWLRFAHGAEERDLTAWEDLPRDPLIWSPFRIQFNEFEGGGIAIGLSCTHMEADPTCLGLLFRSWAHTYRHQPIDHPPSLEPFTLQTQPINDVLPSRFYATKASMEAPPVRMATATFKFSGASIKEWLEKVHDKCPGATPFDLLATVFWTRVARLSNGKSANEHSLTVCLDSGGVVKPGLPLGYFGNTVHFSRISLDKEEMDGEVEDIAALLHNRVSKMGAVEVNSEVGWLELQKGSEGQYAEPFRMYGPELTCVNMEHMITGDESLLYTAFFEGDKKPVHVSCHVGNAEGEGLIMVMPSLEGGLSRTVIVALPHEQMLRLRQDDAILRLAPTMLFDG